MTAALNVRQLLREGGKTARGQEVFDLSGRDFLDFTVEKPVGMCWEARPGGGAVRLELRLDAALRARCVRCLDVFEAPLHVRRQYDISPEDLAGAYPEYPVTQDGMLDLAELAYGEIVMEAPLQPLCRASCPGLGAAGAGGGRYEEEQPAEEEPDPRWQALRDLLDGDGSFG